MIRFLGNRDHVPMLWDVEVLGTRTCVVESYDGGQTWIVNCDVQSVQDGWDFVSAWFAQFYEGT